MIDSEQTGPAPRSLRLLIVDDDEVSRELLTLLAEAEGHRVDAFAGGDEALTHLQHPAIVPDAILADLHMPGLTGNPLAHALRAACPPATCLLAMSGTQPEPAAVDAFDIFLLKPFTMNDLTAAFSCRVLPAQTIQLGKMIDMDTYELLKKTMGEAKLVKLFEMCLTDAAKRIATMRAALTAGETAAYRSAAHAIKGGCGLVGATQLYAIAHEMETTGPDSTSLDALNRFVAASARLQRMLVGQET